MHEIVRKKSLFKNNYNLRECFVHRIEFESTNPSLTKKNPNPTLTKTYLRGPLIKGIEETKG